MTNIKKHTKCAIVPVDQQQLLRKHHPGWEQLREGGVVLDKEGVYLIVELIDFHTITESYEKPYGKTQKEFMFKHADAKVVYRQYASIDDLYAGIPRYGGEDHDSKTSLREFMSYKREAGFFESPDAAQKYVDDTDNDLSAFDIHVEDEQSTALVGRVSKELIQSKMDIVQSQRYELERVQAAHDHRVRVAMHKMDVMRRTMNEKLSIMKKEVAKLEDFIWTIELYMGVHENVIQLKSGDTSNDAIKFFQKVLYMDVEYGKPGDETIDFSNIEKFDEWLIKDDNYKLFTTERCVRVFRVRRTDMRYSENPWINSIMNQDNHKTYFLIRNGDNVYRVYADIVVNKLFPGQDELLKLQEKCEKSSFTSSDEVEKKFRHYHKQIVALQGMVFRTPIFAPLPPDFNLLNPAIHDTGLVQFVYAKNELVEEIREPFNNWMKRINDKAKVGNRIIWIDVEDGYEPTYSRFAERFYSFNIEAKRNYKLPDRPEPGLISHLQQTRASNVNSYSEYPCMMMIPHAREYFDHSTYSYKQDTSRRTRWYFSTRDLWLNYDEVTLDDVEYYLNNRHERENYMYAFPILFQLRDALRKDKEHERMFIKMMQGQINATHEQVQEAIDWWKLKNKWKRSLQSNDMHHEAKAFRMILRQLKKTVK